MVLNVFHTQENRYPILKFPVLAEGSEQWLGDGYYFWQHLEFAQYWGKDKKSNGVNGQYSIFNAKLEFDDDEFIDTVFNEHDYDNFVSNVEKFAQEYYRNFGQKPSLEEFNDFIYDNNIWDEIKVIRFQDIPENNRCLKVRDFYYKKRIQIRVNEPTIITNFALNKK